MPGRWPRARYLERALDGQRDAVVVRDLERVLDRLDVEAAEEHGNDRLHLQQGEAHADALVRATAERDELERVDELDLARLLVDPAVRVVLGGVLAPHLLDQAQRRTPT